MTKLIRFNPDRPVNRMMQADNYILDIDMHSLEVDDKLLNKIKGLNLNSIMISGDSGRRYACTSAWCEEFKNNIFDINLGSIERLAKEFGFAYKEYGVYLCNISILSKDAQEVEVKLVFKNPKTYTHSYITYYTGYDLELCIGGVGVSSLNSKVMCQLADYIVEKHRLSHISKELQLLVKSLEKLDFPVELLEVGLYGKHSEESAKGEQQSFSNKNEVLSGMSLISQLNNFSGLGSHYGKYAVCIVM